MRRGATHGKAALGVFVVVAALAIGPTNVALGINPIHCGKPPTFISNPAVSGGQTALAARSNPYRVLATYYYRNNKRPQDERVMRLGTSRWGYTHIRDRRGWNAAETYVIVGCVPTYGRPISRQGHAYVFRYGFPGDLPGKFSGREFEVIYETSSGPKGVITAYDAHRG